LFTRAKKVVYRHQIIKKVVYRHQKSGTVNESVKIVRVVTILTKIFVLTNTFQKTPSLHAIGNPKKALGRVLGTSRNAFLGLGNLPTTLAFSS
jgi:hypothetical protein